MQLLLAELVVGEWLQGGRDEGKTKRSKRMKGEYTNLHCSEILQISLLCTIDIHVHTQAYTCICTCTSVTVVSLGSEVVTN